MKGLIIFLALLFLSAGVYAQNVSCSDLANDVHPTFVLTTAASSNSFRDGAWQMTVFLNKTMSGAALLSVAAQNGDQLIQVDGVGQVDLRIAKNGGDATVELVCTQQ